MHPSCAGMAALTTAAPPLLCAEASHWQPRQPLREEAAARCLSGLRQCCRCDAPVPSARLGLCAASAASQVFTSKLGTSFPSLFMLFLAFPVPSISIMSLSPFRAGNFAQDYTLWRLVPVSWDFPPSPVPALRGLSVSIAIAFAAH